jgi:gliding motility-associated-like protein
MASILAVSPDRQTGWNFQWAVYNQVDSLYSALTGSFNGESSVLDTISVSSGYQVTMAKGAETYIYRVWIVFNDFQVEITNKDAENNLLFGYFNCSSLDLRADTTLVQCYYFNPDNGVRINIFNNYSIRWTTNNSAASIPANRLITRVNSPPSEDTWYFLNLTDRFKLVRGDSVFYKSIQSDAKISGEYINLSDSSEYPLSYKEYYNDGSGSSAEENRSAPGKYRFDISASRNLVSYKIDFGDGEIAEADTSASEIVHEFKKPGTYKVVLTTKSDRPYECTDSATVDATLAYGKLLLPNVFTPNNSGDNDILNIEGSNDIFRSEDVSVVTMDIAIFDRAGRKVHAFSGNIRDWEGWDGNVMHSNREAPEGVYFYVITALFYYKNPVKDPITSKMYKGFIHLYRKP